MIGGETNDPRPDPDDAGEVDETLAGGLRYPDEAEGEAGKPAPRRVGPEDEAREDLKGEKSAAELVKERAAAKLGVVSGGG